MIPITVLCILILTTITTIIIIMVILIIPTTYGMPPSTATGKKTLILRIMGLRQAAVHIEPADYDHYDGDAMLMVLMVFVMKLRSC